MSRTVTIHSDGTARGTVVLDEEGNRLGNIGEVNFNISALGVAEINITILKAANLNVQGELTTVNFVCPACGDQLEHQCDTVLGGP